jgi:hypothetical protein
MTSLAVSPHLDGSSRMSLPMRNTARSIAAAALSFCALAPWACGPPGPENGRARLAGTYVFADRRVPTTDINPAFRSASLKLMPDGTAQQICEYKDGTKYESSGMTWTYRGDGNIHLSPLKDCSWVWGELMDRREGLLETPQGGASLVVEWSRKPVILMHPDLNAFYEWQGPAK